MTQQLGVQPDTMRDLFYLASNHECRTTEEQAAMECVARKLDYQQTGSHEGGGVLRDARETCNPCPKHADDGEHAPEGGLA